MKGAILLAAKQPSLTDDAQRNRRQDVCHPKWFLSIWQIYTHQAMWLGCIKTGMLGAFTFCKNPRCCRRCSMMFSTTCSGCAVVCNLNTQATGSWKPVRRRTFRDLGRSTLLRKLFWTQDRKRAQYATTVRAPALHGSEAPHLPRSRHPFTTQFLESTASASQAFHAKTMPRLQKTHSRHLEWIPVREKGSAAGR